MGKVRVRVKEGFAVTEYRQGSRRHIPAFTTEWMEIDESDLALNTRRQRFIEVAPVPGPVEEDNDGGN